MLSVGKSRDFEDVYKYIYIYLYICKDLLHRNSLKYMWGYKIVPTTNLPHITLSILASKSRMCLRFSSEK